MSQRILIEEDEADVAELVANHLQKAGFSVDVQTDGLSALSAIKSNPPALIVLDLMLPQMSGLDLCRVVKADARTREIVVLILSARADEIDRVIGFELGKECRDRKSTRLNSSHTVISYAVFCLKKKN